MSVHVIAGRLLAAPLKTSQVRGGYDADLVDDALDQAAAALTGGASPETVAAQLRGTVFSPSYGSEGYDPQDVQRFLSDIVARLERLDGDATTVIPTVGGVVPEGLDTLLTGTTFSASKGAGYRRADVDLFVARIAASVAERRPAVEIATMANDSQFTWTRKSAYDSTEVDAFLDRLIGLLASTAQ